MPIDPELTPFIERVSAAYPVPPETLPPVVLRAKMEALSAAARTPYPPGLSVRDEQVPVAAGTVRVRIYRPAAPSGTQPCFIYMHGGGWVVGSIDTHDPIAAGIATGTPCTVISVDYSLAPEYPYPTALEESYAVSCWAVENADRLGIDAERMAIGGDSAGGNLATAAAMLSRARGGPRFCLQVLVYPALDTDFARPSYVAQAEAPFLSRSIMIWFWTHYLGGSPVSDDPLAVPMRAADLAGLPPALVSVAEYDPLCSEGEAYAARLAAAGVPVALRRGKGLIHGFMRTPVICRAARAEFDFVCATLRDAFATDAGADLATVGRRSRA